MPEQFYVKLTNTGLNELSSAKAAGTSIGISDFSVGDSGGEYYDPSPTQTSLVNEIIRLPLNSVYIDKRNSNWIVCEGSIPADHSALYANTFWIREIALWSTTGALFAVAKFPETFKNILGTNNAAKALYIRLIIAADNATSVTLSIDPNIVTASQEFVMQQFDMHTFKNAVRAASITNISLSGAQTIDGVAVVSNDRVLVTSQTDQTKNGIYVVASGAWSRASDAVTEDNLLSSSIVSVSEGITHADTVWMLSTDAPIVVGATALAFIKIFPDETVRTINDASAPTSDSECPSKLFSWIGYMLKIITGETTWRTLPQTNLKLAKTHIDSTSNPHATTADQIGAASVSHTHNAYVPHSLATAANDFLVASAVGIFVKKTLAEVRVVLGLGDAAYKNTGTTSGTVAAGNHAHSGALVQHRFTPLTAAVAVNSVIPFDDSKPQKTEGVQIMSDSITPRAAGNIIRISAQVRGVAESPGNAIGALFQDAGTDAIAAEYASSAVGGGYATHAINIVTEIVAPSTAPIAFSVRVGAPGRFTVNGELANRKLGGAWVSSITIDEIAP